MTDQDQPLDPIESALLELSRAEEARVFEPTPIEPGELLRAAPRTALGGSRRFWLRAAPVAAVLMLAAGVWSAMFIDALHDVREQARMAGSIPVDRALWSSFADCLNGPVGVPLSPGCAGHDRDRDGNVDLRDVSAFQVAFAGPTR